MMNFKAEVYKKMQGIKEDARRLGFMIVQEDIQMAARLAVCQIDEIPNLVPQKQRDLHESARTIGHLE